jgi:hypothetical protein
MIEIHSPLVLEITAHDAATIEEELNTAEHQARGSALHDGRHGILVTQHGHYSYTVAVSREVPYGLTLERRQWQTTS